LPSSVLATRERDASVASDDAFDAVVSAVAMWERRHELLSLDAAIDATTAIEGTVWM
jgi:phage baseplate assembly protein W